MKSDIMKTVVVPIILRLFFVVIFTSCLFSDSGNAQTTKEPAKRYAKFLFYDSPADAPKNAFVHQAGLEPQEVVFDRYNFTDSLELSPTATRFFFLPNQLAEDVKPPKGAPFVKIPKTWSKVLILVVEDKSNSVMPIRMLPINASDDAFGPGELSFINFSDVTVFGKVGNKTLHSKPQSSELIKRPIAKAGNYMVVLDSFKGSKKNRRRLVQQKCQFDPAARVLTLILPLPPPRLVTLYSAPISDF